MTIKSIPAHLLHVDLIMKGPFDTVSIPVPLQDGHLSGLEPFSLPVPVQDLHVSIILTYMSLERSLILEGYVSVLPFQLHLQPVEKLD